MFVLLKSTLLSLALLCIVVMSSCTINHESLVPFVHTYIGTSSATTASAGLFGKHTEEYGQTMPAVFEPHGMNFWTAQTQDTELKCKAPYYYKDSLMQGFRNSHWMEGSCTQDYGSFTLMPMRATQAQLRVQAIDLQPERRASRFSHDKEEMHPDYYAVSLDDYQVRAEMTGLSRSAIFTFGPTEADEAVTGKIPASQGDLLVVVNPNSDEGEGYVEIDTVRKEIRGYNPVHRIYQGRGQSAGLAGYFIMRYQDEPVDYGTWHFDSIHAHRCREAHHPNIGAYVLFHLPRLTVKVASSFTSFEAARRNLDAEIPHWSFQRTREQLHKVWEKHLRRIEVETPDTAMKAQFYSAMYRSSFLPHVVSDVDGTYPMFAQADSFVCLNLHDEDARYRPTHYYDDFSAWDTYRAEHPLINLLSPRQAADMMQSLVMKYRQGGWMPIFPCWNSYTAAMIGDHVCSLMADAYLKGVRGFDIRKAYEGLRQNAFVYTDSVSYVQGKGRRALQSYMQYGYIPLEDGVRHAFHTEEQVSRTLEYAYDDYCLAQIANELMNETHLTQLGKGQEETSQMAADYEQLMRRAENWRNVLNPRTGYVQGRHADGSFCERSNPIAREPFITEGAPCHYTWYVPHNPQGLIAALGGEEAFVAKLDSTFEERRYWHGNEPCHQVAYMYAYARQPWKTQHWVRQIMLTEYDDSPGGLSGNEDAGQMASWFMFSAMGFYPVCPGSTQYVIGSPIFPKLTIHLENGKQFTVVAHHACRENMYVQSMKLNGTPLNEPFLSHQDIMDGGILELEMGASAMP